VGQHAVQRVVRLRGILEEVLGVVEVAALEAPKEIRREPERVRAGGGVDQALRVRKGWEPWNRGDGDMSAQVLVKVMNLQKVIIS
jgi:hypothetical protein